MAGARISAWRGTPSIVKFMAWACELPAIARQIAAAASIPVRQLGRIIKSPLRALTPRAFVTSQSKRLGRNAEIVPLLRRLFGDPNWNCSLMP